MSARWIFLLTILLGTLGAVLAGAEEADKKADAPEATEHGTPAPKVESAPEAITPAAPVPTGKNVVSSACLADPVIVEDIQRRRSELEVREKELAARDAELKARERALEEELGKIQAVREDVEKIEGARKKESSDKVAKLVETFETMSPKAASALMATLDESLAVATMARITTPKLAKIMNSMEPKKSARLSELLAGVVRARSALNASSGAAVATTQSAKGGDKKNDGQTEQHDSSSERTSPTKREPAQKQ